LKAKSPRRGVRRALVKPIFSAELIFDNNQKLLLEFTFYHGYLTAVSKNVLTGMPIVIGSIQVEREQWLALAEHCQAIAGKLSPKKNYATVPPELY